MRPYHSNLIDWKKLPDGKEKRQAYYCSREWSVKKEAVHARAQGVCERCQLSPIDCVHHLTYARLYHEAMTDLQGICNACHEFIHGKSDQDPAHDPRLLWKGRHVEAIYLAGKITGENGNWRSELVENWKTSCECWRTCGDDFQWNPVLENIAGKTAWITGPFWMLGGTDGHAVIEAECFNHSVPDGRAKIKALALQAINRSQFVFAWINSLDCFGTLAEIVYARTVGKPVLVVLGNPSLMKDLWFVLEGCDWFSAPTPKAGWDRAFGKPATCPKCGTPANNVLQDWCFKCEGEEFVELYPSTLPDRQYRTAE